MKSALACFPCCLSKGPLKRDSLGIYLTTFSEFVISERQKLWGTCFFSKRLNFEINLRMAAKNWENLFCFSDNCIWTSNIILSLLRTGYFSLAANVLTRSPKIWHVNKTNFLEHNLLASDQWIWYRRCDADLNSAGAPLPCCLSKDPLKRDFLEIYLTTFSESVISELQKLWRSSFFSKCSKFNLDFKIGTKNKKKKFFVSEIIAS